METTVQNQGLRSDPAYIRGSKAIVTYDAARQSDVLSLDGDGFGEGWLQLPALFETGCSAGFTFSMKVMLDAEADNYSKLFQFSSLPFGTGNAPAYSSPDISIDLNDKTSFRASIFAGNRQNTVNDNCHRAIFPLAAEPTADIWHELTFVCTPAGSAYYLDGAQIAYEAETADAASASLFASDMLSYYVYNSIGHSLYTDHDLKAKIDDVAFFDHPLSEQDAVSLPLDDASFLYTFEKNSVQSGGAVPSAETAHTLNGTAITSLPELQVSSPDGSITVKFWKDAASSYYYSVYKATGGKRETVVEPSKLGFTTTTEDLSGGFSDVPSAFEIIHDEFYTMPYGKHSAFRDYCRELSFPLRKGNSVLTVTMRVYNDGIGLRYSLNHSATIKEEATQVIFPDTGTFWGNGPNSTYEWDIIELTTQKITDSWASYSCPLTGKLSDTCWVLLSEANVFNEDDPYCSGCLSTSGGSRALKWKFGVKTESVVMSGAFHTPWRALVIGDDLNETSNSDLIMNLNPPSVLEDTSWIKPGKCAWSWWSSGGDSPVEYHVQKDYIDFAAENGWDFVCLDFGWALWDDSANKVRELCEYGAERGIGIYLWYGVNNTGHKDYKDSQGNPAYPYYSLLDEETIVREFQRISALGVKGVKVDYYESDTQGTMKQMQMCAEIAAKNHLMVLFHGCTLPKGESRTYPHVVSYEAINGTEYYKWFDRPSLASRVSYVFTRNVVGSADFTPTGIPVYGIKATAGFALADTVTIESGIQHFAHSVYTYEGSSALPMLNDIPVAWDELKILDGYPMQFNVTARRSGKDWYIASATIDPRTVEIPLSDLISEGTWDAYIFADNDDGSDLKVTVQKGLTAKDVIRQNLLPNGGFVIKLTQNGMKLSTSTSNYRTYEAEHAVLSGNASITTGANAKYCSNNGFVGYVGGNATNAVTFEHVNVEQDGEYTIRIYYLSGEYRDLMVSVNGTYAATLTGLYANRNDWKGIRAVNITVSLKKGDNVIRLYNDKNYGPNIDRIAVALPEETLRGDVNADGTFSIADIVMLQKWLVQNGSILDWKAGDLNEDRQLNSADLIQMKRMLLS
ncbi:glycoside hydrolase family 97 catalytic domain-containing protein [Ruminococcus sp.]|uniref:glycoside hydrolase family 97 catalytic domain-containing protein n=1 Tax=Ruminococcus sp. TaxID=41978 RepID=UPI002603B2E4|nr:glycoside hydrolase family 97 catalytic domain-containing protein [Ruminococcus sp.]MDD7556194.1 glycoside hydrolase family 97 catalytic domain-containing protein [Ruminococcus sp.]